MKSFFAFVMFIYLITLSHAFADPGGKGRGNSGFGSSMSQMPPGLQKKGLSPGLHNKNKTPYGWSRGKKTGWDKTHYKTHGYDNFNGIYKNKNKTKSIQNRVPWN